MRFALGRHDCCGVTNEPADQAQNRYNSALPSPAVQDPANWGTSRLTSDLGDARGFHRAGFQDGLDHPVQQIWLPPVVPGIAAEVAYLAGILAQVKDRSLRTVAMDRNLVARVDMAGHMRAHRIVVVFAEREGAHRCAAVPASQLRNALQILRYAAFRD